LDPPGVLEVRELLRAARDESKSIFFSSHQLSEVEQICDRIAFLDHGRLLRQGPLATFLEDSGRAEVVVEGVAAESEALRPYQAYLSYSSGDELHFVVPAQRQREIIERIWATGGTLKSVAPQRRTLEELFIRWTQNSSENAAGKREA